ncbi:hypothetical protein PRIPAC_95106 [Pristionchus pacificus]|uniref:Uncharacterized protein n=1 Tax=Pristionchus pacificus TaxID=54126 RepID=A0A2A6BR24_PRIPA|nr:hypothetical protein PRIPAC_95106 [Pristionchus pacificus]|eukprot:PDM68402.1 hypothetical protein PRIPAC_46446 [Pristionchus pacificus]
MSTTLAHFHTRVATREGGGGGEVERRGGVAYPPAAVIKRGWPGTVSRQAPPTFHASEAPRGAPLAPAWQPQ